MEDAIKAALIRLLEGIKQSDTEQTLSAMDAVEQLLGQSRGKLHPQLAHFLERRSYAKALESLGGAGSVPKGASETR
jgi:hypothetical protein